MKDIIIQVAVDLIKLTFIINLYSSSSLCPSHLWPQNNLKEVKQDGWKAACCNGWGKKKMDKHMIPGKKQGSSIRYLWNPKVSTMKTLQATFSADVTGFRHMILINGPGNPAMETSALCWEFSPLFYILQSHKQLLCKCCIAQFPVYLYSL